MIRSQSLRPSCDPVLLTSRTIASSRRFDRRSSASSRSQLVAHPSEQAASHRAEGHAFAAARKGRRPTSPGRNIGRRSSSFAVAVASPTEKAVAEINHGYEIVRTANFFDENRACLHLVSPECGNKLPAGLRRTQSRWSVVTCKRHLDARIMHALGLPTSQAGARLPKPRPPLHRSRAPSR